ncbi:hypothetical protein B2D07_03220 [Desulfococcus multivorans]|nr:hypothetical protein B2D07_03220 [Desulfococcus multivorans]
MARRSLFVLATGVIHAWHAGKSKWFVETASGFRSIPFSGTEPPSEIFDKSNPALRKMGADVT